MAEFSEVVKIARRMCKGDCAGSKLLDCPLDCYVVNDFDIEDFERTVLDWAAEHPELPDKEKVVQGLRCHNERKADQCRVCPYEDSDDCISELVSDALILLERSIIMEPIVAGPINFKGNKDDKV